MRATNRLFNGGKVTIPSTIREEYDLEETGRYSGIQTNGTLIKDAHIEMFEKYRVQVGISCDGPSPRV
jgi:uncharacterized protein